MDALVDTHCHLLSGELRADSEGAYERARSTGVRTMVLVGIDLASSKEAVYFAEQHTGVYATVGVHPNDTQNATDHDFEALAALAHHPRVVALGETGLDFYRDSAPADLQERALQWHCEQGIRLGRPLVLHIRDAYPRIREVLGPFIPRGLRAVLHCFGGGPDDLHPFLEWGFYVSFSGIITYPKADNVRAAALACPLDRCLVETDSPWLAPMPKRGQRNEPAYVRHTAERLAQVKGVSPAELAAITTRNASEFFALTEAT